MSGFRSLGEQEEVEFECQRTSRGLEATRVSGKQGENCHGSTYRPRMWEARPSFCPALRLIFPDFCTPIHPQKSPDSPHALLQLRRIRQPHCLRMRFGSPAEALSSLPWRRPSPRRLPAPQCGEYRIRDWF